MAVRLYLASSGATVISPTIAATWDTTVNFVRAPMRVVNGGSTLTTKNDFNMDASVNTDFCAYQWVCAAPLAAQTLNTTDAFRASIQADEEAATQNISWQWNIRVFDPTGTTARGTTADLLAPTELAVLSLESRYINTTLGTAITVTAGDYLVIEAGYNIAATPADADSTSRSGESGTVDLAAADGDLGTVDNPWVEFDSLIFQGTTSNQLMLMGAGT